MIFLRGVPSGSELGRVGSDEVRMPTVPITRRFEWDAAHRIAGHEGKCGVVHGHRYMAEVSVRAPERDELGRVVDFGVVKREVGRWIDDNWDHTAIFDLLDTHPAVLALAELHKGEGRPVYWLEGPPTVENLLDALVAVAEATLEPLGLEVVHVRIYETPNCWADWDVGTNG